MPQNNPPVSSKTGPVAPYEVLADIYDFVMRHVDYVEWADYVEEVFGRFSRGATPQRVVEVACGTGTMALELATRGYLVHGMDLSQAMVEQARAKAARFREPGAQKPTFSVRDMRDLPEDAADAALCLYDSINYCLEPEDLRAAIAGLVRLVRPDGLCIFDVTTETNSLRYFADSSYHERGKGFFYERHSQYDRKSRIQTNSFTFRMTGEERETSERHVQRIYPLEDVLAAVDTDSCYILGAYDDFTLDPADDESERVHVILQKKA